MKYQTFTDAAGFVLFSIVLDKEAVPFEIEGTFGLDPGENDFSLGIYLSPVTKEESRYEDIQRHLRKLRELPQDDEAVKAAVEARVLAEEAARFAAEEAAKAAEGAAEGAAKAAEGKT